MQGACFCEPMLGPIITFLSFGCLLQHPFSNHSGTLSETHIKLNHPQFTESILYPFQKILKILSISSLRRSPGSFPGSRPRLSLLCNQSQIQLKIFCFCVFVCQLQVILIKFYQCHFLTHFFGLCPSKAELPEQQFATIIEYQNHLKRFLK